MRRVRALALLLALALPAGCATGTDDELQPRPTPTVTVTGAPQQELPATLDLDSDLDFSQAVVWAAGGEVSVGDRTVDVAPLVPTSIVVLDRGLLVLSSDERVWFVAGRRVTGLPLPATTSMALSADGTQVVLQVVDRDEPVAYTTAGALVDAAAVAAPRSTERTTTGPGPYAVVRTDGRARVVDEAGDPVPVAGLPADLQVRGWLGTEAFFGTASTDAGTRVLRCRLAGQDRCEPVGDPVRTPGSDLVLGQHPDG